MILVSGNIWVVEKFTRGHPKGTCQMRVGWVFSAIFDQYVFISRKRRILDTKLLWDGNRKPYTSYRMMMSLLMTLSDPWPGFQGHGSFKRRLSPKWRILQTQLLHRMLIGKHRQAIDRQLAIQLTTPLLLCKPCKLFASVVQVCQRQLGFLVGFWKTELSMMLHSIQSVYCSRRGKLRFWVSQDMPLVKTNTMAKFMFRLEKR